MECAGSFASEFIIDDSAGSGTNSLDVGDIDGDGDLDLIVSHTSGDGVYWYEALGGGAYARHTIAVDATSVRAAILVDVDGDGDLDAVSVWYIAGVVALHTNNGAGVFTTTTIDASASQPNDVAAGDLDGDGKIDLLVAHRGSDSVVAYLQSVAGTFVPQLIADSVRKPWAVVLGDIDQDGDLDAVVSSQDGVIMLRQNDQQSLKPFTVNTCSDARGIALADISGDGKLNIVATCLSTGVVVWYEEFKGLFSEASQAPYANDLYRLHIHSHQPGRLQSDTLDLAVAWMFHEQLTLG